MDDGATITNGKDIVRLAGAIHRGTPPDTIEVICGVAGHLGPTAAGVVEDEAANANSEDIDARASSPDTV